MLFGYFEDRSIVLTVSHAKSKPIDMKRTLLFLMMSMATLTVIGTVVSTVYRQTRLLSAYLNLPSMEIPREPTVPKMLF